MKVYRGEPPHKVTVEVQALGVTQRRDLTHHIYHSPTGYSWGYEGSGPAELAKDILWDVTGSQPDPAVYQAFKREVIAGFDGSLSWMLLEQDIRNWLAAT